MADQLIASDGPYAEGYIVDYGDGTQTLERGPFPFEEETDADEWYEIKDGDEISQIAYRKYGNSKLWHVIVRANDFMIDPLELETGVLIRIPSPELVKNTY